MKQHYIIGIAGLGILNGLFSPLLLQVLLLSPYWLPSYIPISPNFMFMFSSLATSTLMIMFAGVPAALYERFTGKTETTEISSLIWIGALAILSVPAIERMTGF